MADLTSVTRMMGVMAAAYPGFTISAETIRVYGRMLADIPDKLLEGAGMDCMARCRFFPTIAEIREAAYSIKLLQSGAPSAFEAWGEVSRLMAEVGSYRVPEFSHPWIATAVRQVGGWTRLCQSENSVADRARFLDAYADAQRRDARQETTMPEVRQLAARLALRPGARK